MKTEMSYSKRQQGAPLSRSHVKCRVPIVRFWKGDKPWFEGIWCDSETPANSLALTSLCNKGISAQSILNVTILWLNHIWKCILITYLTLCIRIWWLHLLPESVPVPVHAIAILPVARFQKPSSNHGLARQFLYISLPASQSLISRSHSWSQSPRAWPWPCL